MASTTNKSSKLSGYPGSAANDFGQVAFIENKLVYDPSYIFKFKGPTINDIIDKLNELCVAVADLQQVTTSLIEEEAETREVMNDVIWAKVKDCSRRLETYYSPENLADVFDKKGVVEEGLDPYTCHIKI